MPDLNPPSTGTGNIAVGGGNGNLLGAVTAGVPVVGNIVNAAIASHQNLKSREFADNMYTRQRLDALMDWNAQNEYNSPKAQMARLKAAGLNPNLVYGNGATAMSSAQPRASSVPGYSPHQVSINPNALNEGLQAYQNLKLGQAQTNQVTANTTMQLAETALTQAKTIQQKSETTQFNRNADTQSSILSANLQKQLADTKFTLNQDERNAALNAVSVKEAVERILTMRIQNTKIPAEINELKARVRNLNDDSDLKEWEYKLNQMGMNKTDAPWYRVLFAAKYLNNQPEVPPSLQDQDMDPESEEKMNSILKGAGNAGARYLKSRHH